VNIAIFGDSFANGETGMGNYLSHYGLTQYLMDDGHFVINFSRQGNQNSRALIDYRVAMRQNEHIEWDMAIVFQTEVFRDGDEWVTYIVGDYKQEPISVRDVETVQLKEFYCNLKESQDIYKTPIYLVGGTADTLSPEVVEECGLKCACQSMVNLCVNGDHLIEEPVTDFVFIGIEGWQHKAGSIVPDDGIDDKEYFLKLIQMGENRYKLMGDYLKYFAPRSRGGVASHPVDHPNRNAYKKLFNHLKSEGIV
jgi:hypothetical protein